MRHIVPLTHIPNQMCMMPASVHIPTVKSPQIIFPNWKLWTRVSKIIKIQGEHDILHQTFMIMTLIWEFCYLTTLLCQVSAGPNKSGRLRKIQNKVNITWVRNNLS